MKILSDWTDVQTSGFQKEIVRARHKLAETGLFSDEALAKLLEEHPAHMLDVCTMGDDPRFPNKFRTGDFRGCSGATLIEAAKAGRVWINMRRAMNLHPKYKAVLDRMYGDVMDATGVKIYNPNGGILISSPVAKVPFHCDKTETILWHVRGKKRIFIYPVTKEYLPNEAYENIVINMLDDDVPYKPEMDKGAQIFDLQPGEMITWKLNAPHKVENDAYCVSVTTEYSTRESAFKNAAMVTNATLRNKLGMNPKWDEAGAVSRQIKSVFGKVLKKTKLASSIKQADFVTFKIDPSVPGYVVDTEPFQRNF